MLRELAAAGARAVSDLALLLPARAASGVDQHTLFSEVGRFLQDQGTQRQVFTDEGQHRVPVSGVDHFSSRMVMSLYQASALPPPWICRPISPSRGIAGSVSV